MTQHANQSGARILYEWLQQYEGAENTYRAYHREFERLQIWLLLDEKDFHNVATEDLIRYLEELAGGLLSPSNLEKPHRLSNRTLSQARSVLVRMFAILQSEGLRGDNPARRLEVPASTPATPADFIQTRMASERWREVRQVWVEQPEPEKGGRDPLARIVLVAEWSYWTALRRSELAALNMADIVRSDNEWQVAVPRFGRGKAVDLVHVPAPALDALRRYRVSRALPPLPNISEVDVPLIAQLRSEIPVEPWTIGHILREASRLATREHRQPAEQCALSNRELRRYLVADGLAKRIPYPDLSAHVRSRYTVGAMADASVESTIPASLALLASNAPR